jgi:hypothetical protein
LIDYKIVVEDEKGQEVYRIKRMPWPDPLTLPTISYTDGLVTNVTWNDLISATYTYVGGLAETVTVSDGDNSRVLTANYTGGFVWKEPPFDKMRTHFGRQRRPKGETQPLGCLSSLTSLTAEFGRRRGEKKPIDRCLSLILPARPYLPPNRLSPITRQLAAKSEHQRKPGAEKSAPNQNLDGTI